MLKSLRGASEPIPRSLPPKYTLLQYLALRLAHNDVSTMSWIDLAYSLGGTRLPYLANEPSISANRLKAATKYRLASRSPLTAHTIHIHQRVFRSLKKGRGVRFQLRSDSFGYIDSKVGYRSNVAPIHEDGRVYTTKYYTSCIIHRGIKAEKVLTSSS